MKIGNKCVVGSAAVNVRLFILLVELLQTPIISIVVATVNDGDNETDGQCDGHTVKFDKLKCL